MSLHPNFRIDPVLVRPGRRGALACGLPVPGSPEMGAANAFVLSWQSPAGAPPWCEWLGRFDTRPEAEAEAARLAAAGLGEALLTAPRQSARSRAA